MSLVVCKHHTRLDEFAAYLQRVGKVSVVRKRERNLGMYRLYRLRVFERARPRRGVSDVPYGYLGVRGVLHIIGRENVGHLPHALFAFELAVDKRRDARALLAAVLKRNQCACRKRYRGYGGAAILFRTRRILL